MIRPLIAILLSLVSALPFDVTAADDFSPPNVVIILADDLGYGDPGCFNPQSKIPTPAIDRLALEGMRFTDAHAAGTVCHPSRYGLLTGAFPFRTDVSKWPGQPLIQQGQTTFASILRSQGYRTAMVGKWHLGFRESGYDKPLPGGPADHGFDTYFGLRASTDIPPYFYIRDRAAVQPPTSVIEEHHTAGLSPIQGEFWRSGGIAPDMELAGVLPRLADEAVSVIHSHADENDGSPLLLYLALTAPHTPWLPAPEFRGRSEAGMYGDFTMMVDAMVGRVLRALDETHLAENTVVLFTSDNGPTWYPEDVQRTGHDSAGGLRGMKSSHWEGGHRMPFVVRWPDHVQPGTTSHQVICLTDVPATLADIAGVTLPEGAAPDSFSFLPVLLGTHPDDEPIRGPFVIGQCVRSAQWKWIEGREPEFFMRPGCRTFPGPEEPPGQLFDLDHDPHETVNLAAEQPELVRQLKLERTRILQSVQTRP